MDGNNLTDENIEIFKAQLDNIYQSVEELIAVVKNLAYDVELIRRILKKKLT